MIDESKWKQAYKGEKIYSGKWGQFGVQINVVMDRPFERDDNMIFNKVAEEIEEALMRRTVESDPEERETRDAEQKKLMECFGDRGIFAEAIPNQYCPRWCCAMRPWYKVTTSRGVITLGWRKSVIHLEWEPRVTGGVNSDTLFPNEKVYGDVDVTRYDCVIHAHGYAKLTQYLDRLLSDPKPAHEQAVSA